MATALELGLTVDDFWRMSPRAIVALMREKLRRQHDADEAETRGPRLMRIPRP
jgi:hypothetical protein